MRSLAGVKLFIAVIACTVYLISFSQAAPLVYRSIFNETDRFASGTMIGPVSVGGLSKDEALETVEKAVHQWGQSSRVRIAYQEKTEAVDARLFSFRIEQSVEQAKNGERSPLIVQLDRQSFSSLVSKLIDPSWLLSLDQSKLERDIAAMASQLPANPSPVDLSTYVGGQEERNAFLGEAAMEALGDNSAEVLAWVANHPEIEIKGKSIFSLSSYFDGAVSSEAMSIIASAIYETILPTNFQIIERHTSRRLPAGVRPGYEAKVDQQTRNFRFYNPNISAYTLRFQPSGNGFRVALSGLPFAYKYVVKTSEIEYFDPKTIVRYSSRLQPGERETQQQGKQGVLIKVKKETYDQNHQLIQSEMIAEDFYPPVHTVEVRGLEPGANLDLDENGTPEPDGQPPAANPDDAEPDGEGGNEPGQTPPNEQHDEGGGTPDVPYEK